MHNDARPFDLDQAITRYLAEFRIKTLVRRDALDELEDHLRTDVEDLMKSGLSPEEAFSRAVQGLGGGTPLVREFAKLYDKDPAAKLKNLASHYFDRRIVMRLVFGSLFGAFFMLGGMLLEGGHVSSIVQLTAFLIVAGGAFGALIIAYPARLVRQSLVLALTGRQAVRASYLDAARVFRSFGDMAILAGFVGVLFGTIHVLENLDKPDNIGPGCAVAIITILYGLLIKLFIGKPLSDSFTARAFPSVEAFDRAKNAHPHDDQLLSA